jgi:xanthine/uracil permease
MKDLLAISVWGEGVLDDEPKKYRSLQKFWLPLYDGIAIAAGIFAWLFGSRLLDRIYGDFTDAIGLAFALVAFVCFVGVSFPKLWRTEFAAKCILIGLIVAYVFCILLAPSPEQLLAKEAPNFFVACMLVFGLPLACFRMNMLAVEEFDRRVQRRVRVILDG